MKRIDLETTPEPEAIEQAIAALNRGEIIVYPTETFYGMGARIDSREALERIFTLKGRSTDKCLTLIAGDIEAACALSGDITPKARKIMEQCWPGPLTLVLPAAQGLSPCLTQCNTVAVRMPGDSFALRLAQAAGFAITATSANPAGLPPASDADAVEEYFKTGLSLIIDGGHTPGKLPSTIVDVTRDKIKVLRAGAVSLPQELR